MQTIRSTVRVLAGALPLLAFAACAQPTDVDRRPVEFRLAPRLANTPPFSAASTAPGTMTVDGVIEYGGCQMPKPVAVVRGDLLLLQVWLVTTSRGGCPDILYNVMYQATIGGLEPGTYHLRVEHAADSGTQGPVLRHEQDVTVQ